MKVRLGKGKMQLKKSDSLIGLKTFKSRSTGQPTTPEAIDKEQKKYTRLGGFQIFDVGVEKDVNTELDSLRDADEVEMGTHVYVGEDGKTPFVPNGDIYITFTEGVDEEEQAIVLDEFKLVLDERKSPTKVRAITTAESMSPIKVAYFLEKCSLVEMANADMDSILKEYGLAEPSEALFPHQWHLKNTGTILGANPAHKINPNAHLRVLDAWNRLGNKGSSDITIAVIDMGFDLQHTDIKDNIVHAFDVWENGPFTQPKTFRDHGTPCAGLALARENSFGTIGVAPNSKFMPLSGLGFSIRDTEIMFNHCLNNGADIISCSWGSIQPEHELDSEKEDILRNVATKGRNGKGCVILFAAGNENQEVTNVYGRHPDVICIGASTSQDVHASYSNRGFEIDVVAPSNGDWPLIAPRASWDSGHWFDGNEVNSQYKHFGGTSAATPLVAGVCALMLSANPNLTAKEVKGILMQTADKIGHPTDYVNGHSRRYGAGRVNADKAVAEAIRRLDSPGQPAVEAKVVSGGGLFRFSVSRQQSVGFGVQIGVFAEYGNVLIQVEKLQNIFSGEPVVVNINELGGKTVYKVLLGQSSDINDAKKLLTRMRSKGFDGFVTSYEKLK
jgi:subtilisin family serine protease